ncbi:MAG: hypothetical protein JEZ00_10070 [Anaerolineaceae bacterium]|nr:hypothetical protein [Anaerolineaceae bacterium]
MKKKKFSYTIYLIIMLSIIMACSMPSSIVIPVPQNDAPVSTITLTSSPPSKNITPVKITATVQESDQNDSTEAEPVQEEIAELGQPVCIDDECLEENMEIDFLIVTRPYFVTSLEPFIAWKVQNGFRVGLVMVDWLDETFEGRHMAERMKTGMHTIRRDSSSTETLYVLLVGDTEIDPDNNKVDGVLASYDLGDIWNVPTGYFRRSNFEAEGDVLPSDAYYVEDRDWDPENTGLNPVPFQKYGQGTFDATIFLGRWSVRTPKAVQNITTKTLSYSPTDKILFSEEKEFYHPESTGCNWPPTEYRGEKAFASCYIDSEVTRSRLFNENAPWLETEFQVIDIWNPEDVKVFFDKLLNYDGAVFTLYHGYYYCMYMDENECIGIADLKFNNIIPFYEPAACYVGSFYAGNPPTITESLHNAPTGPVIVAGAGHNMYGFYEELRMGEPVGKAFWEAGATYAYWQTILLLGDPSLPVFVAP